MSKSDIMHVYVFTYRFVVVLNHMARNKRSLNSSAVGIYKIFPSFGELRICYIRIIYV